MKRSIAVIVAVLGVAVSVLAGPVAEGESGGVSVEGRVTTRSSAAATTAVDTRVSHEAEADGLNLDTRPARGFVFFLR